MGQNFCALETYSPAVSAFGDPIFCFRTENRGKEPTKEALPLWNLQMFALFDGTNFKFAPPTRNQYHKTRFLSAAAPKVNDNRAKKGASALFIFLPAYHLYTLVAFAIEVLGWVAYLGVGGGSKAGEGVSRPRVSLPPPWRVFLPHLSARAERWGLRSKRTHREI